MITATIQKGTAIASLKNFRREKNFTNQYSLISFDGQEFSEIVNLRIYQTQAKTTACIWLHAARDFHNLGGGTATGGGYHRSSKAVANALKSAGIELSEPIDGRGNGAIRSALEEIAKNLNLKHFYILEAYA